MSCTALTLTEVQIIVRKYLATHILYCSIHLILSGVNSTTPILPLPTLAHWVSISESEQAARMAFLPGLKKQINKVRSGSSWKFDFLKFFSRQISLWARESVGWKEQNLTMISTGDEDEKNYLKRVAEIVQWHFKTKIPQSSIFYEQFCSMEKKTDLFNELVDDLQIKTKEYLQPNPMVRAKMAAVKGISMLSGQAKASTYPQVDLQSFSLGLKKCHMFLLCSQKAPWVRQCQPMGTNCRTLTLSEKKSP